MHQAGSRNNPAADRAEAVIGYVARGWRPVPIPLNQKRPTTKSWPELFVKEPQTASDFAGIGNNGVILGIDPLTDIDVDCSEAIIAGQSLLPPTGVIFGRQASRDRITFMSQDPRFRWKSW